jgi:hypothetical protein
MMIWAKMAKFQVLREFLEARHRLKGSRPLKLR